MASRVRILSFVLERIKRGDFSQKAPVSKSDSIGKLGIKINEVAESLAGKMRRLEIERVQFETVINNIDEALLVTNNEMVVILVNPAWYRIFRTDPKSLGKPLLEVVRVPEMYDSMKNAISGGSRTEAEFVYNDMFFVAKNDPFETENFSGCVTVLTDVTKTKKLEGMRRDFTANVSHQMKTPLTSILGYSEIILSGAINDKTSSEKFIRTIHEQSLKLKALIDDVLALSKIESPSFALKFSEFDVNEIVEDCVTELEDNTNNVSISYEPVNAVIRSDRAAIRHVIHNVLDNAIKYSSKNGNVQVAVIKESGCIKISIRDNGSGIEKDELDHIFERFYRVDTSISVPGTGLGLAIAKHLCDRINASISVVSDPGKGSTFELSIPFSSQQ